MAIPQQIGLFWPKLCEKVIDVHFDWKIFRQLYGQSPERIRLLNEAASQFFGRAQTIFLDNIQLELAKLNDRAETGGRENLTLKKLMRDLEKVPPGPPSAFLDEAERLRTEYCKNCRKIVRRRNRLIAHSDYDTALNRHAERLEGATHQEIEEALMALVSFMRHIEGQFEDSETIFDDPVLNDDGDSVVFLLKRGLRHQALEKEGKLDWSDIKLSPWYTA